MVAWFKFYYTCHLLTLVVLVVEGSVNCLRTLHHWMTLLAARDGHALRQNRRVSIIVGKQNSWSTNFLCWDSRKLYAYSSFFCSHLIWNINPWIAYLLVKREFIMGQLLQCNSLSKNLEHEALLFLFFSFLCS